MQRYEAKQLWTQHHKMVNVYKQELTQQWIS